MAENGLRREGDEDLKPTEAGRLLGVSRETARKWVKDEKLKGHWDEAIKEWRISRRSVEELAAQRGGAQSPEVVPSLAPIEPTPANIEAVVKAFLEVHAPVQVETVAALERQIERERERAERAEARLEEERSRGLWARLFGR